jgi:hypothetical protein
MLIIFKEGRYFHQMQGASRYYVSKCGAIYSTIAKRLLRLHPQTNGYLQTGFSMDDGSYKRLMLHRIVALQFVHNAEPERTIHVNHKNGNKKDCRACNLEWLTNKENNHHARAIGLMPSAGKTIVLPSIRGFCAPMKDYQTIPRFYRFEATPTSYPKPDEDASRA